jgi:nucleoside-diphosphate-sugar epimerase
VKALVTGATGFVGSHLVEALRREGHAVTALVRNPGKAAFLASLGVQQISGDLSDPDAIARAADGCDVVFHVAGLTAALDEAGYLAVNRDRTRAVVEGAERAGAARLVYVSSMAAGGPSAPGRPLTGPEPPTPVTAYGRSKLAGEQEVRAGRVPWSIVRPPMVYGPRDREVLKVFRLARLGIAPVFGSGRQELSAVHAADLAASLVAAAGSPAAIGGVYYACHPQIFTSEAFVRAVGRAAGRAVVVLRIPRALGHVALSGTGMLARAAGRATILNADKGNEFFQPAWTGDPGPLTAATGWRAVHDLASGLADTWQWYRSARWI